MQTTTTPTLTVPLTASADDEPSPSKVAASPEVVTPHYPVSLTAYNAVPSQTDGDPSTTASGMPSNPEVVAARSRDLASKLPFGTIIALERTAKDTPRCRFSQVDHLIGYRVIEDTMDSRWTNKIDVLFNSNDTVQVEGRDTNPSVALGVCDQVTVRVVGHIATGRMPKTQAELQTMFSDTTISLAMR